MNRREFIKTRGRAMQWISVEERLPETAEQVLACTAGDPRSYEAIYCEPTWFCGCAPVQPTHWTPLPEPPKEPGPFHPHSRSVFERESHWVCYQGAPIWGVGNVGDAQAECAKLNKLWALDKGTKEEH